MTRRNAKPAGTILPDGDREASRGHIIRFAVGAGGIVVIIFTYHVLTWRVFTHTVDAFTELFSDFVTYYYPMGEAIFSTKLPVEGFLYSPFVAILLAIFPPLGPTVSLVLWGGLQVFFILFYLFLFRQLVPAGLQVLLLFVTLVLTSYPLLLNFIGGSVSVFMMASLLAMLVLNERGYRAAAAGFFAFAVGFKFFPLFFIIPFALGRNTRFFLALVAACIAFLFVIPGVVLGFGDTLRFYSALSVSFRESDWVVANPHSNYFPHLILRLADAAGHDVHAHLPLLGWIAYGFAAANMGLVFLIQRAQLRHSDLWSFLLVFLMLPFVLKTSWPHDFVFLAFGQALLVWRLLEQDKSVPRTDNGGKRFHTKRPCTRGVIALFLVVPSIVLSNIVFFNLFGDFSGYGFYGFLFWADLLLLIAIYVEILPAALRRFQATGVDSGRHTSVSLRCLTFLYRRASSPPKRYPAAPRRPRSAAGRGIKRVLPTFLWRTTSHLTP
ncbi:MAG: DUF2029 domain-containing protein, partial [Candidatus Latescibacterota bacterium]